MILREGVFQVDKAGASKGDRKEAAVCRDAGGRGQETKKKPPTFVLDDHLDDTVEQAKSPKPPSAEEFKSMLSEGLTNVTKKEQLDQMMT